MGAFQSLTSTVGLFGLVALLLFLLLRYLGGWTRVRAWIWSTREEKMVLLRAAWSAGTGAASYAPTTMTTTGTTTGNPCNNTAPTESDLNLSSGGSFRRFENTERGSSSSAEARGIAMKNLNTSNNNNNNNGNGNNGPRQQWPGQFVPPPPLRPPSGSTGPPNYLPNQGSIDSVFLNPLASPGGIPPKLPPPPTGGGGRRGSGSAGSGGPPSAGIGGPSTNPFVPLIQASTQFFSQTIQSFQNASAPSTSSTVSTSSGSGANGISMGELLFSGQQPYNNRQGPEAVRQKEQDDKYSLINFNDVEEGPMSHSALTRTTGNGAYPLSPPSTHHPIASLGRSQHQQKMVHGRVVYEDEDNMILIETDKELIERARAAAASTLTGDVEHDGVFGDAETLRRDSLLESMRAEIRLENERMEDATKSLLMEDDATPYKRGPSGRSGSIEDKSTANNTQAPTSASYLSRPTAADRKYSAPEIGYGVTTQSHSQPQQAPLKEKVIEENDDDDAAAAAAAGGDDNEVSLLDYVRTRQASIDQIRSNNNNGSSSVYGSGGSIGGDSGISNNGIPALLASLTDRSSGSRSSCSSKSNCSSGSFTSRSSSTITAAPAAPAPASKAQSQSSKSQLLKVVVPVVQVIPSCTSPSFILGPASTSPAAYSRTRSFSLRQQSSVDSIGDISDLMSPESGTSLPSIQRAMSCDSVCSDTSVILGDLDPPHVTGQLFVGLEYDSETADLIVNVIEGKDLLGLDPDPTSPFDSYVRVYLLPDKTTNMQTRIYRKSLSPVYKEKFMFGLDETELPTRSLVFYLYATNKHSNTLIGEAELKLNELDLGQPKLTWLPLTDTAKRGGELGEIMFSLSYLPTAERLTVVVVKARNLKFPHERETGDPFVKVYLLQKGKKVSKKKSSTKRSERNPIFNEAMIFSVPTHALQTIQLRITVSDSSESDSRAYSIGHIIIGSASTGKPLSHWSQMLASLRKPIAMWHSLRK